jgi:Domain of unknown function (DUF4157)
MPKIIYTSLIIWAAGFTVCQRLICINPKYAADTALLAHELTHVKQMGRFGTLSWWWGYLTSRAERQAAEVEAYQVQIMHGLPLHVAAVFLQSMYYLGITYDEAVAALSAQQGDAA